MIVSNGEGTGGGCLPGLRMGRDASRLARLHRAGELTAIRVPTEAEEAVREALLH